MGRERTPILYLAPWVDLGGSDKGTIDWFKHVDRERWAPSLITTQPSPNRWLHQIEPFAEEVWELPDLMPGCSFPEFILGFIESRGVRLVHIMNSRLAFDLLPDMACLREPPAVVVQMHAEEPDRSGYVRYAARRYGNLIDAFSVTSEQLKKAVAAYDIPPSRIEVIYTGVDGEEEFNRERVEPLPLSDNGVPRILWPGRLVEQKDPMLTLEAISLARAQGAEFVLDIVGDGHMKAAVEARAKELGVDAVIRWSPASQEMPRWYRSADLLLMTSVFEGVPYVIYESLVMGIPVVAPALPGNLEFMDESNGILVDPRDDASQYADAIVDLLHDEERRREMGERSRRRMLSEFSLAEMGRRHDALYERLLATRPASSRWRSDELFGEGELSPEHTAATTPPKPLSLTRRPLPERSVGVIVPCYRHGIFLDGCIRSIKSQTLAPARIVVVDDGSDDPETIEALERLERDPEVTLLRQTANAGPSAARNRGLAELDTSYVLPIDADDRLLPDAIERMLGQIETAPEDIGFVYPHSQHIGNRSDYVHSPAYNLWLLTEENYCPAPALFDRRVFAETGISYPEDIVVGHEDWDLILQLAEHGVHGIHASGPTFLYRRQGFSRVNAVDYGPHVFQEAIEHRHPLLYGNRDPIKARWAPALSIVLLDRGRRWDTDDLADLPAQTCRDFEILASAELGDGVRAVGAPAEPSEAWLQAAMEEARGHWVCVLEPAAAASLRDRSFVERLIYCFWAHGPIAAVVLGEARGVTRHAFAQLDDEERLAARPVGVTFERPPETSLPAVRLGLSDSPLTDLVLGLQSNGIVQWRIAPIDGRGGDEREEPEEPSAEEPADRPRFLLDLNYRRPRDKAEALTRRAISWQAPRLPELTPGTVRRWENSAGWTPAETQPLCRHIELNGEGRIVTNDRNPPYGYRLEFDLGAVHVYGAPGTSRLVDQGQAFALTDEQNDLGEGLRGLGYIEQAPLPMLEPLEMRRMPGTQEHVLVAGGDDPLFGVAEPVESLGWIEPFPILPRGDLLHTGSWGVVALRRYADRDAWRHRYRTGASADEPDAVTLGSLHRFQGDEEQLVPLRLRDDGRLATELASPGRASRDPRKIGRWIAAPLTWNGRRPKAMESKAAAARAGHLARRYRNRRLKEEGGVILGWLRREAGPGCSPLFSTTHPATGDQFVTRSAQEAVDLGYLPDGILGFILDAGADSAPEAQPETIPWGSRFGRERRYVEGWIPG